jgi:outer membrane protein
LNVPARQEAVAPARTADPGRRGTAKHDNTVIHGDTRRFDMTKCMTRLGFWAVGLALAAPTGLSAQQPPARPQQEPYVVGRALPPVEAGRTLITMTLDDAIARALETNLDIQTARLNPQIQRFSLLSAQAAFTPTLNVSSSYNNTTRQSTSQLDGGLRTTSESFSLNTTMSKTLPWYGGRLTANFNNSRSSNNSTFSTVNPSYTSRVQLGYSMPLLAGFRTDNQRATLETARIQSDITDLQVQAQIENIKYQVRQYYWALRAAIEQIEIQRRNLAQAQQQYQDNQARVQGGRMTELQLVQSEAQVASAQQSLLNATIQWRNMEFTFKRLMLSGPDDNLLMETINPTDQPVLVDRPVDIQAAIDTALQSRADIRQQREQRVISTVNLDVSKSNALPDLTLSANYSLQGTGGNQYSRDGLGGDPVLVQAGGYLDGLTKIKNFDEPTWSVSLTASYPLGTNSQKASLERARLQLRQTDLALRAQELNIITQVTQAGLNVQNSFLQYEAARRNREAAERNAESELLRYSVGVAINFEVVTAQNQLTSARLSELQAIINHVNAVNEFQRVQRVGN